MLSPLSLVPLREQVITEQYMLLDKIICTEHLWFHSDQGFSAEDCSSKRCIFSQGNSTSIAGEQHIMN